MKRRLALVVALTLLLPVGVWAGLAAFISRTFRSTAEGTQQSMSRDASRDAPQLAAAKALLAGEPLLAAAPDEGADAAAVLGPLLLHGLALPVATRQQLEAWDDDRKWVAHAAALDPSEAAVDLRWMAGLDRFERWTPPAGPAGRVNGVPLRRAAQLRLLRGLRDGAPAEAAREVRSLVRLMIRSGSSSALWTASEVLRTERRAFDAYAPKGVDWRPWTLDQVEALTTLCDQGRRASMPVATDAMVASGLGEGVPAPVRCAYQRRALLHLASVRDSPEPMLAPAFERAREWRAHPQGCDFARVDEAWEHGPLLELPRDFGPPSGGPMDHLLAVLPTWMLRPMRGLAFIDGVRP